jgi:hypothetical protein
MPLKRILAVQIDMNTLQRNRGGRPLLGDTLSVKHRMSNKANQKNHDVLRTLKREFYFARMQCGR